MLPFAANYRGKRIAGTSAYRTLPFSEVENMKGIGKQRKVPANSIQLYERKDGFPAEFVNFDLV